MHYETVLDDKGTLRWKASTVVRWLVDKYEPLNDLHLAVYPDHLDAQDVRQFYRDMGYSLDGYHEIFDQMFCDDPDNDGKEPPPDAADYGEILHTQHGYVGEFTWPSTPESEAVLANTISRAKMEAD